MIFQNGVIINKMTLTGSIYLKGGKYWKEDTKLNHYGMLLNICARQGNYPVPEKCPPFRFQKNVNQGIRGRQGSKTKI